MTTLNGSDHSTRRHCACRAAHVVDLAVMLKPAFVSGSTFAMFAAIVVCTTAIAINSWRNAQAPTSTSEVIHDAEIGRRL